MTDDATVWRPQAGPQHELVRCPLPEVFFGGSRGGGKLSPLTEPVLTSKGWREIGSLEIGDSLIDPTTGGSQIVIGIYPQGVQRIFRVTCDDGAWTDVGLDHLWLYRVANHARPGTKVSSQRQYARVVLHAASPQTRWDTMKVGNTAKIIEALARDQSPRIPLSEPVLFDVNGRTGNSLAEPYVIGLLLGDGSIPSLTITCCEDQIRERLLLLGFRAQAELHTDGKPVAYRAIGALGKCLRAWTQNHGLAGRKSPQKFIPSYVLTASLEYRVEFLRGLMDSDGTVDERGRCYFISTSRALAEGVQALCRSLGGKARLRERQTCFDYRGERKLGLPSFQVRLWLKRTSTLFWLDRKRALCTDSWNGGYELTRKIVSVHEVEPQEAVCIKVSGPRGLYVTRDYIVTHNTDGVLGKWALKERRYAADFNAVAFRRTTVSFEDAIARGKQIYLPLGAKFTERPPRFRMPNGGRISFSFLESVNDANDYQGRNVSDAWVEEAGQYPESAPVDRLFGVLRSAGGVPVQLILTANPGGAGQHWLAERYGLIPFPTKPQVRYRKLADGSTHKMGVIPSLITDNRILLDRDPNYIHRLQLVGSAALVKAWLEGDWSAIEGAFFPEWSALRHVLDPFPIPDDWTRFRSGDWGSAAPFSIGWWAVVGDDTRVANGTIMPRGALVRYREWYGASAPNTGLKLPAEEVAAGILAREAREPKDIHGRTDIAYGVMDPAAFASDGGPSIAERMAPSATRPGILWMRADNKRVARVGAIGGWDQVRARLVGTAQREAGTGRVDWSTGNPMLYVFSTCRDLIRTLPALQHDSALPEDVNTDNEDHAPDETRYACMSRPWTNIVAQKEPSRFLQDATLDELWDAQGRRSSDRL